MCGDHRVCTTHASTVGCAGDCTGDGRGDVAAGTEYYGVKLLDRTGAIAAATDLPAPPNVARTLDDRTAVVAAGAHLLAIATPN